MKDKKLVVIGALVIVVLAALAAFFFGQYNHLKKNPEVAKEATTRRLVEKVGKLYAVPTDEQPTIAEVKDKDKLKEQAFFQNAENGDYILIYPNAKTAILFRETDNKLINVGPIAIDSAKQAVAQAKASVKVINGSNVSGRAAAVAGQLASKLSAKVAVDPAYGDAKTKNITKTLVVDIKGGQSDLAKEVATALGGVVGALPSGENKPASDLLVITGP